MKKSTILMTLVILAILSSASVVQAEPLKVGSTGTEITMLQSKLQTLNYNVGPVDGIFGSKTKATVSIDQYGVGTSVAFSNGFTPYWSNSYVGTKRI